VASLSLPGRTNAWFEATLYGRVNGYVTDFNKDIGDHVKAGDVLALIETPELDQQYQATQAKQQEIEAERNVAQSAVEFAKITYQRWEQAAPDGVVAIQERDQKKSEWDVAVAKLKAADAQVTSGNAELKRLKSMLDFKQVRAPFDGVIIAREVDKGSLVTAGSTTNTTPLFTIARYDKMRVFIDVPEAAVPMIVNGMDVNVEAREYPGRPFTGKVARTAEAIDTVSKTLKVEVDVPNPDLKLLPGMYVMSAFQTTRSDPPLRVPAAALAFSPRGAEVAIVDADHRVKFKPVTIGRDLGDSVEISSGLRGDETIALNVGTQIPEGERVSPTVVEDLAPVSPPAQARPARSRRSARA